MRVYFDDQVFLYQTVGGISRYFAELMRVFRTERALGVDITSPRPLSHNRHLLDAKMGRRLPECLGRHHRLVRSINGAYRDRSSDIIHHTQYDSYYLPRFKNAKLRAITIYDMIPELFPDLFRNGSPHKDKRSFVDKADLVLCISEATKRDLINFYGPPVAPVVVTHLGVSDRFHPHADKPDFLPDSYLLYVGLRGGYKDFMVLARAFSSARVPTDVMLIAAGGGAFSALERAELSRLGIESRVQQHDVAERDLPGAFAHALCFVSTSRHEGFGLPILEAMASGSPTILSASSAHPEVGGAAALYFSAGDDDRLAALIAEVVTDPVVQTKRRTLGIGQAMKFSWRSTAQRTAAAYKLALGLS